jgi:CheY-like chemotaxis protein
MTGEAKNEKVVLFVDDDEISNFVSVKTLEDAQIADRILSVTGAREALDLIKEGINGNGPIPDLIFLDINMPIMSGWDFLEEYKEIKDRVGKKIYIIILTSSVYKHDKAKAATYEDVDDYTLKPLDISDLIVFKRKYLS